MKAVNLTDKIEGYFLSFTPDEKKLISEGLAVLDYEESPEGLKEFILESMYSELEENSDNGTYQERPIDRVFKKFNEYIEQHPDEIRKYQKLASSLAGEFSNKIFSKLFNKKKSA